MFWFYQLNNRKEIRVLTRSASPSSERSVVHFKDFNLGIYSKQTYFCGATTGSVSAKRRLLTSFFSRSYVSPFSGSKIQNIYIYIYIYIYIGRI